MMNVSAPAGLSDSSPNSHRNGHSGRGFAPRQRRVGRAGRSLRAEHGGQDHDDDHGQGREQDVLHHGVAEKGNARFQLLLVLGVVGLRIDDFARARAAR